MDSTLILVTTLRMVRDYQQTIDSLLARIAELEARGDTQQAKVGSSDVPEPSS